MPADRILTVDVEVRLTLRCKCRVIKGSKGRRQGFDRFALPDEPDVVEIEDAHLVTARGAIAPERTTAFVGPGADAVIREHFDEIEATVLDEVDCLEGTL